MKQPKDNKTRDLFDGAVQELIKDLGQQDEIARLVTLHAKYINSFFLVDHWSTNKLWSSKTLKKPISNNERNELIRMHLVMTTNKIIGQFK